MLFYQLTVQYEWKNKKSFREEEKKERKEKLRKILKKTNHHVKNASLEEPVFVYCTLTEDKIGVITSLPDSHRETPDHISGCILAELSEKEGALRYKCSGFREITLLEIKKYLDRAEENDLIAAYRRIPFDDIYGNPWFSVKEQMISKKKTTKTAAFRKADHLLADQTLREELDRIFAKENRTIAIAHPVHYIIRADKRESAEQIIDLLTHVLKKEERLLFLYDLFLHPGLAIPVT